MTTYGATVPVIRNKNRTGLDNPSSGALTALPIYFGSLAGTAVYDYQWKPPAGTAFEIVSIDARATTITNTPSITVGTATGGAQIVAAVNLTTNLGALTLVSTAVTGGQTLDVRITDASGDAASNVSITVYGYTSIPPTVTFLRGDDQGHF